MQIHTLQISADTGRHPLCFRLRTLLTIFESSAFSEAWNCIFESSEDATILNSLRALFPGDTDLIEDRGFSKLHKAILNLECVDLKQQIGTYTSILNSIDANGYTAIMWAARRGDFDALEVLVKARAHINSQDKRTVSALQLAAKHSDLQSVKLLLEAGANSNHVDAEGYTALHSAVQHKDDLGITVECLVKAGMNPNVTDRYGASPLHTAALHNNVEVARTLLTCGTNINMLDDDGDSALLQSVFNNSDEVTQLLLSHEADYTSWWSTGSSILHLAALSGGMKTLDILLKAELQDVDPDATSHQNQTVLQIALARKSKPEGFVERLQELLLDIRTRHTDPRRARSQRRDAVVHERLGFRSTSNLKRLRMDVRARLHHRTQGAIPLTWNLLSRLIWIFLLLTLSYFGVSYICTALGLDYLVHVLTYSWSLFGPEDFTEL